MITHAGHRKDVCEFGTVHTQCRCMDPGKTIRSVPCPSPASCSKQATPERTELERLRDAVWNEGTSQMTMNDDCWYCRQLLNYQDFSGHAPGCVWLLEKQRRDAQ